MLKVITSDVFEERRAGVSYMKNVEERAACISEWFKTAMLTVSA